MTIRTESEIWADERRKVSRKLNARGRAFVRWFVLPEPEPDHFVWHDLAVTFPVTGEG